MNKSEVTIAVDGSLFRYHPILHVILEDTLKNLVSPLNKVNIRFFLCIAFRSMHLNSCFSCVEVQNRAKRGWIRSRSSCRGSRGSRERPDLQTQSSII